MALNVCAFILQVGELLTDFSSYILLRYEVREFHVREKRKTKKQKLEGAAQFQPPEKLTARIRESFFFYQNSRVRVKFWCIRVLSFSNFLFTTICTPSFDNEIFFSS